jgi:predicted amidophosphoribosyltransferase
MRRTRDQVELFADVRRSNAAGACISRKPTTNSIILVDNIFMSGATLSERATVLKKAKSS